MSKILLVEDDRKYATLICDYLRQFYTVEVTDSVVGALEMIQAFYYELLIVDWQLTDATGPELIAKLRKNGLSSPILILTGRDTLADKEHGFDVGADDYLTKAAHPRELLMRIKALLRRPPGFQEQKVKLAPDVEIDLLQKSVFKNGQHVHLLPKEFAVLEFMSRYPQRVLTADELLDRIWPSDTEASSHTVRATISRIRIKLDSAGSPSIIQTKYKSGYQLRDLGHQS